MVFGVGMLAGDTNHGAAGKARYAQACDGIGKAAAGGNRANSRIAGDPSVSVGCIGGSLLVTHVDHLDVVVASGWPESGTDARR